MGEAPANTVLITGSFSGALVDRAAGVIRGVSVITEGPAVGHIHAATGLPVYIDRTSLEQVKACAEKFEGGLKVKADHGSGVFAVTGYLKNFRFDGPKLRADLYILETDPNREKLFEMAAKIPDTFGLSVAFSGSDEVRPDRVLSRCLEIYSADLVAEPAANPGGLFNRKVDAINKETLMATEPNSPKTGAPAEPPKQEPESDLLAQCRAMMEAATAEYNTRLAKLEAAISALKPGEKMATTGDGVTGATGGAEKAQQGGGADFAALRQDLTELAAKVAGLPQQLAKEFAGKIGLSAVTVSPAGAAAAPAGTAAAPSAAFAARVEKHFTASGSKAKAMSLAIAEDEKETKGAGYRAFLEKPERINYQKQAA